MASSATLCNNVQGLKPTLIMILAQTILALTNILYKLAMYDGMSVPVLVAYRFMLGAAFILPLAFFVERFIFLMFLFFFLYMLTILIQKYQYIQEKEAQANMEDNLLRFSLWSIRVRIYSDALFISSSPYVIIKKN